MLMCCRNRALELKLEIAKERAPEASGGHRERSMKEHQQEVEKKLEEIDLSLFIVFLDL